MAAIFRSAERGGWGATHDAEGGAEAGLATNRVRGVDGMLV